MRTIDGGVILGINMSDHVDHDDGGSDNDGDRTSGENQKQRSSHDGTRHRSSDRIGHRMSHYDTTQAVEPENDED